MSREETDNGLSMDRQAMLELGGKAMEMLVDRIMGSVSL